MLAQAAQQSRDAGPIALRIEGIDELMTIGRQFELWVGELRRESREALAQVQCELLLPELRHQRGFFLHQDELSVVDHTDPVRHLLGLFDIVRRQDDGDAVLPQ